MILKIELVLQELSQSNSLNESQIKFLCDNYIVINKSFNEHGHRIISAIIKQYNNSNENVKYDLFRLLDYYRKINRIEVCNEKIIKI